MDSSRSGLLSTLLMTLPLIVVPAIALLRPPGQAPGVSTSRLDASDDELQNEFEVIEKESKQPRKPTEKPSSDIDDEFDDLINEDVSESTGRNDSAGKNSRARKTANDDEESVNPFDTADSGDLRNESEVAENDRGSADGVVEQLNALGALRTMWFEAGSDSPVGFAVFFRGQTELMRMRFEAVGQSREECARGVLDQVIRWQAAHADDSGSN